MRRFVATILACMLLCGSFTGCRKAEEPSTTAGTSAITGMALTDIVDAIYAKHPMELPLGTISVDLADTYAVESYLGLSNPDLIAEAVASESMLGAQAYSLVLCRVKNAADAPTVAQQMHDGINQRKWVCVVADDLMVSACGDVVMLVMISSEYTESGTAQSLTEAFRQVCGTDFSAQIG